MVRAALQLLITVGIGLTVSVGAQNLNIGSAEQSAATSPSAKPIRGMKSDQVRANFGIPQTIRNPVGNPPIIRWEYSNFVVFFEYDTVIHAVNKR